MTAPERGEPANLDDVQATDRLLSRLGARTPEPADLDDPLFGALDALAREVDIEDASTEDEAMRRLVDALGGRPLYVLDGEDVLDPTVGTDLVLIDDPSWEDEPRPSRVIDLTAAETADEAREAEPEPPAEQPAEQPERMAPAARVTELPAAQTGAATKLAAARPGGGWQATARKLPLPVAAALAVFALGGGITSALTGDPMAPVTGIVEAVSGGQSDDGPSPGRIAYASVERNLAAAKAAAARGNYAEAQRLIVSAEAELGKVDAAQVPELQRTFAAVKKAVPPAAWPDSVVVPSMPPAPIDRPAATPTTRPSAAPSATPVPSATEPPPSATTPPPSPTPPPPTPTPTETPVQTEPSVAVSPAAVSTP